MVHVLRSGLCVAISMSLLGGCSACAGRAPDPAAERPAFDAERDGAVRHHVEELFRAARARECSVVRELMPAVATDDDCTELFEDWEQHGLELVEIRDARPDGRDPRAIIVRCRVRMEGEERDLLLRATQRGDGRWAIAM